MRRRDFAIVAAVGLVLALVIAGTSHGLGDPSVPEGEIAVVEDVDEGSISQADFDLAIDQVAARQGLDETPAADSSEYDLLKESALGDLLLAAWVRGEADERGITVDEAAVDEELLRTQNEEFGGRKAFERYLRQSGYCTEEELAAAELNCVAARDRVELQLLSDEVEAEALPEPEISDEEIDLFYEVNRDSQLTTPETRDVRVIVNRDEAQVVAARAELEADDSAQTWNQAAEEFSTDEATSASGGLREGATEGQGEPEFDEAVFAAEQGELVGPFETSAGFNLIQVVNITPKTVTPLDEAREQIEQSLVGTRQQEMATAFQDDFLSKWSVRTFCAEGYRLDRCSNAEAPADACTEELADSTGCDAPVASTRPITPGQAGFVGTAPQGLPQGPQIAASAVPAGTDSGLIEGEPEATGGSGAAQTSP